MPEQALCLLLDQPDDVRDRHALHRIVSCVAARVEGGLEVDAVHGRMIEAEADDAPDLVLIDAAFDRGHENDVQPTAARRSSARIFVARRSGSPRMMRGLAFESIELEVDGGPDLGQLREKASSVRDALAVRVDHDEADAARLRRAHHRMICG